MKVPILPKTGLYLMMDRKFLSSRVEVLLWIYLMPRSITRQVGVTSGAGLFEVEDPTVTGLSDAGTFVLSETAAQHALLG